MDNKNYEEALAIFKKLYYCGQHIRYKIDGATGRTRILRVLYDRGTLLQKDLQYYLNIKSGSLSDIIIKMEQEELLIRKKDKKDKRQIVISLTEKGQAEGLVFFEAFRKNLVKSLDCLSQEELVNFSKILEKLLNSWTREEEATK